jgi:hypothetical protein
LSSGVEPGQPGDDVGDRFGFDFHPAAVGAILLDFVDVVQLDVSGLVNESFAACSMARFSANVTSCHSGSV